MFQKERFIEKNVNLDTRLTVFSGGGSGIRTHAPFRTNGFQDRLVMTTSISLRVLLSSVALTDINSIKNPCFCQEFFIIYLVATLKDFCCSLLPNYGFYVILKGRKIFLFF